MDFTNIWNKLCLLRKETLILCFLILPFPILAQRYQTINLPNSDNEKLHYGFVIGMHVSKYKIKYSNEFVNRDTLYAINPVNSPGFTLGFLINKKVGDFFDVRVLPMAGFYENKLNYVYKSGQIEGIVTDVTYAEIPILLKYKSQRRQNIRMYLVGGVRPSFEVTNKEPEDKKSINIQKVNLAVEYGVGFDLYYPMFKFSPEIRFSQGLGNMLAPSTSKYNTPLEKLKTHTVSLFLIFGS